MSLFHAYDPNPRAALNPEDVYAPIPGFPETVLVTFRRHPLDIALEKYPCRPLADLTSGEPFPIYQMDVPRLPAETPTATGASDAATLPLGIYRTTMGASMTVALMEEVIAMGGRRFIFFGSCGSLDRSIPAGHWIVPTAAYRDEGTSYHYFPAKHGDYIPIPTASQTRAALEGMGIACLSTKVWTTDGLYRETRRNMAWRREEGCRVVDMECAAIMAAAAYRQVSAYEFFYAEDNLDAVTWEPRIMGKVPASASELHLEAAIQLAREIAQEARA